jgi:hypothetical protein
MEVCVTASVPEDTDHVMEPREPRGDPVGSMGS